MYASILHVIQSTSMVYINPRPLLKPQSLAKQCLNPDPAILPLTILDHLLNPYTSRGRVPELINRELPRKSG